MKAGRPNLPFTAALTILSAWAINSFQDVLIKSLGGAYPFHEMQAIRCLVAVPVLIATLLWREPLCALWRHGAGSGLRRGLIYAVASLCFYLTIIAMPFAEAVAIYFTMPLIIAVLAGPMLGEAVPAYRWVAAGVGFSGVLVMLRPGMDVFEPAAAIGILSALLFAIGHLTTRRLGTTRSAAVLAVHQNAMYILTAGALASVLGWGSLELGGHPSLSYLTRAWVMPTPLDALLMLGIGLSTGLLFLLFTLAYRLADSSFVAPFEYSAMLWAVLLGWLVLGEVPDLLALCGIGLILAAGLFMLLMDRYMTVVRPSLAARRGTARPG